MDAVERAAWLRLMLTPGLGPRAARELLAAFGLPTALFAASPATLAARLPDPLVRALRAPPSEAQSAAIDATERWLAASPAHRLLTLADADYPRALLEAPDPPIALFAVGDPAHARGPALAIVGARSATRQGEATAEDFARTLAGAGLTVVSGLALGIDAAAHRGALAARAAGGPAATIAVLGTGVDVIYPLANRALTERIRRDGLVLSEFPLGTPPLQHNFPRRNRLIAWLSRGVLVVEAAVRSGSLITARLAGECGREVFAIPGSIHSPLARGCHRLIKDGAKLVETAADVLDELRLGGAPAATANGGADADRGARPGADPDAEPEDDRAATAPAGPDAGPHAVLLAALGTDPVDLDTLAVRTGLPAGALSAALLDLELTQDVERLPGGRYQRLRSMRQAH